MIQEGCARKHASILQLHVAEGCALLLLLGLVGSLQKDTCTSPVPHWLRMVLDQVETIDIVRLMSNDHQAPSGHPQPVAARGRLQ
jgi:hypothetical protein